MVKNNKIGKCPKCNHEQKLIEGESIFKDNVYQDITGKFTMCNKCDNTYHVEV